MQLVQRLLSGGDDRQGLDVFEVAEGLRKLGHAVTIRSALGGGGGNECLRNLTHRFLPCRAQGTRTGSVDNHSLYCTSYWVQKQASAVHLSCIDKHCLRR